MDRDNTIARLENIAKHAVHTAGEDTFILSLDDGLAIHEAIEALKAQLSQQGTTSDLISRQAAIDALNKQIQQCRKALGSLSLSDVDKHAAEVKMASLRAYRKTLENLPTIQPEPQEGHWIQYDKRVPWRHHYKCSVCGNYLDFTGVNGGRGEVNFCPNCGARMKGAQNG